MKLQNTTKIPREVLYPLLSLSARKAGARSSGVLVKVRPSKNVYRGRVHGCGYWGKPGKWIKTDAGVLLLWLPKRKFRDGTDIAKLIYSLMVHEWTHIRDLQKCVHFDSHKKRWRNRIQEKRAIYEEYKAKKEITDKHEEAIGRLANWYKEGNYLGENKV